MSVGAVNKQTGDRIPTAGMPAIDDALDLTSVNPVQNAIITAALANKQDKTDNNLETTSKTVVGAVNELKSGLTNLDNEVNGDATVYPYADVVTIEDAVPSNLADCSVKIEPVQDLHGYGKPWVGGAGKNKLNFRGNNGSEVTKQTTTTTSGASTENMAGTLNAGTYTFSNISGVGAYVMFNSTDFSHLVSVGSSYTFTYDGESYLQIQYANISETTTFKGQLEEGSTATLYAPWSNICPITGHTEVDVQRDGVNQWEFAESYSGAGGLASNLTFSNALKPNTYTMSCKGTFASGGAIQFTFLCEDGSNQSITLGYDKVGDTYYSSGTITKKIVGVKNIYSNNAGNSINDVQLELGTSATDYEPYKGKTYTIALGDTIYGGTVDFNTGKLTVDRTIVEVDNSWILGTYGGKNYLTKGFSQIKTYPNNPIDPISNMCEFGCYGGASIFEDGKLYQTTSNIGDLYIQDSRYTDKASFVAAYSGCKICCELATPTTIQLTPQQIQLLKGQNTLIASTGQISVTVNGVSGAIGAVQEQVNELANAVGVVKELRYTGTGTAQNTIDFGNDTPTKIMCIIPDPDEEFLLSNYEAIGEISWGMILAFSYWSTQSGGVPTTSNGGTNLIRMSFSGNTVTLNAGNAAQIANYSGQKYLLKYEV